MNILRDMQHRFRRAVPASVVLCLLIYAAYHLVQGDRGLLAHARWDAKVQQLALDVEAAAARRQDLENRAAALDVRGIDRDVLDQRARHVLEFAHPRDVVLRVATD